ncbi:AGAP011194-PA-like protein [Anopheles sinensis]|uniref:AGAP011194-PA-like protein n=1 Tax=Anopheles sinensis TaxID=74873 RepID=A0A084VBN6_ANOSI|nr:AGAP011194-PA-like protein [Anopheles sinensis]
MHRQNILLWRRGSAVVTAANLIISRDFRFKLLEGYSLQIKNVCPQDAGDYNLRSNPETGHVTIRKSDTATLECKASGNSVPSMS